jgi:hypothetical protein
LLKFESELVCSPCRHDKMIATSHSPVNTVMTECSRQLLHIDTIGPSRVHFMGGKWYILVIVDDYSYYSWVFFLESKNEVFEYFRSLTLRLNNECPNCLKAIRSDNETEFKNASFDKFCLENGIDQQFSTPSFDEFWADAINTACYISNQIFMRSILHLIPFELHFGRKQAVSYFRPFGWMVGA